MPVNPDPSLRYRCLLSLIVLIANTAAPLYSRNGRALLATGGHPVATQSVARVRVVSHESTIQGFRAPVGLSKGGGEAICALALSRPHFIPPHFGPGRFGAEAGPEYRPAQSPPSMLRRVSP